MADDYSDPDANLPYPESPEYPSASVRDLDAPPDDRVLGDGGVGTRGGMFGRRTDDVGVSARPLAEDVGMGAIDDERTLLASAGGSSFESRATFWIMAVITAIIVVIVIIGFVTMPR